MAKLRNLTVWIASSGLGHVARGVEAWAHDLAYALDSRGVNALLCKGAGDPASEIEQIVPCLQRSSVEAKRLSHRFPAAIAWRLGLASTYSVEQTTFAWHLIRLLRGQAVDIVHVQDPLVAIYVQRASQLGVISPRVILAHGTEESYQFLRKLRYVQHLAPWHQQDAEAVGCFRSTWTNIPNFIDVDRFAPGPRDRIRYELKLPRDAYVVLVAAAIKSTHKRIDHLLEEFWRLRNSRPDINAYLVIAGGKSAESEGIIEYGRKLLGDRVRFLIEHPRSQMRDLYRAADLFTLGSLKEMMPISLLEATACGVPALVHQHPVMQWMVGPGGYAVEMDQKGALSEHLARLHDQPNERRRLSVLARDHCQRHFGRDAVVDQIYHYYEEITACHRWRELKRNRGLGRAA